MSPWTSLEHIAAEFDGLIVFGMLASFATAFYVVWWALAAYLGGAL